jgi:hypothetical protein
LRRVEAGHLIEQELPNKRMHVAAAAPAHRHFLPRRQFHLEVLSASSFLSRRWHCVRRALLKGADEDIEDKTDKNP